MRPRQTGSGAFILPESKLAALFSAIQESGYRIVGPTANGNAITLQVLDSIEDLPLGYSDEASPGYYRLRKSKQPARFAFSNSPSSPKRFLFPPRHRLWTIEKSPETLSVEEFSQDHPPIAFFGIRPCDLKAIQIQDKVFISGTYADTDYKRRRQNALTIVANCLNPSADCFCTSVGGGPEATDGFDIVLTELIQEESIQYLAEAASREGQTILDKLSLPFASQSELKVKQAALDAAERRITKKLNQSEVAKVLPQQSDSSRWDAIAERCLACTNCTLVCPTCFCSTIEDETDLDGRAAYRTRVWDSCFQQSFSHVAGGSIRTSVRARYRQWLTHKLSYWLDQFGTIGCVGCGRCITWCPVGIDLVQEANAFVAQSEKVESNPKGVSP